MQSKALSYVAYKFQCGRYNASYYGESYRHLKVKLEEHIGISPRKSKAVSGEFNT